MSLLASCEWSDEYRPVVATIGPLYRVIIDRNGYGWNLQRRRARGASGHARWHNAAPLLRSRENMAAIALPLMHSGYVKEHGIDREFVNAALSTLPEHYTEEYGRKELKNSDP